MAAQNWKRKDEPLRTFSRESLTVFTWVVFIRAEEFKNCQVAWLKQAEKYEEKHTGGYRRIYPTSDSDKYDKFFQHHNSLFQETAASRAREEYAR